MLKCRQSVVRKANYIPRAVTLPDLIDVVIVVVTGSRYHDDAVGTFLESLKDWEEQTVHQHRSENGDVQAWRWN